MFKSKHTIFNSSIDSLGGLSEMVNAVKYFFFSNKGIRELIARSTGHCREPKRNSGLFAIIKRENFSSGSSNECCVSSDVTDQA